jgi:hypothetical protein
MRDVFRGQAQTDVKKTASYKWSNFVHRVSISNGAIALTSVLVSLIFSEITASEAVGVSHLVLFAMLADVY